MQLPLGLRRTCSVFSGYFFHFQLQAVSPCPVSLTELEELAMIYCYFVCQQLIRFNQVTSS